MIWGRALPLGALLLVGCAQRDNPFDPVNSGGTPIHELGYAPLPGGHNKVVWPEMVSDTVRESKYCGNISGCFAKLGRGDTLWIRGGPPAYEISGLLNLSMGGTQTTPLVIRSFRGQASIRYRLDDPKFGDCLWVTQPYVKISGLSFSNCKTAIVGTFLTGALFVDSVEINKTDLGFDLKTTGKVRLSHILMTDMRVDPPFRMAIDSLEREDFSWALAAN